MPEFTAVTLALLALVLVMGLLLGWILRGDRCAKEKIAVNAGWQQQIESQQSEHDRLAKQNKSLMEQINQYQASIKDSTMRAKELSDSLKEAFQRRDELQRQLKDVRSNLDITVAQCDKLQIELRNKSARDEATEQTLKQKDQKIQRLNTELANWQSRVPPLVDRYRARDEEAREFEIELDVIRAERDSARDELAELQNELEIAVNRIAALEGIIGSEHTRIEPVDADTLPDGLDASNEPHDDTLESEVTGLEDQIDNDEPQQSAWQSASPPEALPGAPDDEDGPWARVAASEDGDESGKRSDESLDPLDPPDSVDPLDSLDSLESSANSAVSPYLSGNSASDAGFNQSDGDDSSDDLKQIKGVGPAIERTLHDLGFFRFRQIAEMSEFDIDRVARHLKGFRSRIYREDWIGQARMLQQHKSHRPV